MQELIELFKLESAKAKLISFENQMPMTYGVSLFEIAANFKLKRGIKYFKMTYKMSKADFDFLRQVCEDNATAISEGMERLNAKKKPKCFFRV